MSPITPAFSAKTVALPDMAEAQRVASAGRRTSPGAAACPAPRRRILADVGAGRAHTAHAADRFATLVQRIETAIGAAMRAGVVRAPGSLSADRRGGIKGAQRDDGTQRKGSSRCSPGEPGETVRF
jgi:hypothetical protein